MSATLPISGTQARGVGQKVFPERIIHGTLYEVVEVIFYEAELLFYRAV
ncbi:MAG: hypothetical protein AAF587_07155 [Bacteroidota bacterium]